MSDEPAAAHDQSALIASSLAAHATKRLLLPPLPPNKERNARAGMPDGHRDATICAMVDMTVFGSFKRALVLTPRHCFVVDDDQSWHFGWDEVRGVEGFTGFAEDTIALTLAGGERKLYVASAGAAMLGLLQALAGPGEVSPGGSAILRHTEGAPVDGEIAHADDERLSAHLERNLGELGMVWHEILSDRVHIDIHTVPPGEGRPFQVLVTSGMSARPMTLPPDFPEADQWRHGELCLMLPPDWPLTSEAFEDERNYWPVRLLKTVARIPHDFGSWLGYGHSIPNGDPAEPYAPGVPFAGALLIPPFALPDLFAVEGDPPIHIYQLLPVTPGEMALKLQLGLDGALEQMEARDPGLYGPIDLGRPTAG